MHVYVGEGWHYQSGVGAERKAETAAARAKNGGVNRLTAEGRAIADGEQPPGLVARIIGVDPDDPDGRGVVFWVWDTREQAEETAVWLGSAQTRERAARWLDTARIIGRVYRVLYLAHRETGPLTGHAAFRQDWRYQPGVGLERAAEMAAARERTGGKDTLNMAPKAGTAGPVPAGLVARMIAVDPDDPDGDMFNFQLWETREEAGQHHALQEDAAWLARNADWADGSRARGQVLEILYFGHRDRLGVTA